MWTRPEGFLEDSLPLSTCRRAETARTTNLKLSFDAEQGRGLQYVVQTLCLIRGRAEGGGGGFCDCV